MSYNPDDLVLALDLAADHIKSVSYTSPTVRTVMALGAAITWVTPVLSHVPRLFITGPYGTGKSTLLSAVEPMVQLPIRNSGQLSSTFAYRNDFRAGSVDGDVPTTMVDETKHIFRENGKGGSSHPLYAICTEGYSKNGAPVKYQEKDMNVQYSCYQVAFLASRGSQSLPEDVLDRAIRLELSKKPDGMKLLQVGDPDVVENGRQVGLFLRTAIQAAAKQLRVIVRTTDWYEKHRLDSRTADVWIGFFAIAELAGGQWPALVSAAYAELGAKNARNLPTQFQIKVDTLAFLHTTGYDADKFPARELIDYLAELGRAAYTWDDMPFSIRKYGIELKAAGVESVKSNSKVYYRVSDGWMKTADRIANPVTIEAEDPENDWELFVEEFFTEEENA
jgi:hypothetical protein